jgi:Membrane bound O-acyl transferase family
LALPHTKQLRSANSTNCPPWVGWLPLALLPAIPVVFRNALSPWVFMWSLAFAIYFSLKWLTWFEARSKIAHPTWRSVAYLLAWPGMDAASFLDLKPAATKPLFRRLVWAVIKTGSGATLLWVVARTIPATQPLLRGWVGMFGLILLLHFGTFDIIAFIWQRVGINAQPIMSTPLRSTSLAEFWGKRWNLGFRQLAHEWVFRPLYPHVGVGAAGFLVFVLSGLIHDLVISLPARAGYGLPTAYFALQGVGVAFERSALGKRVGLGKGPEGWIFVVLVVAAPAYFLFHPWFVVRVILPFMQAIHAL